MYLSKTQRLGLCLIFMYKCVCVCVQIHTHIKYNPSLIFDCQNRRDAHIQTHTEHIRTYKNTHTHTHTYTHTHTHIHMHMHTHTQTVDMISAHRVTGHDTRDLRKVHAIVALQKRGNAVLSEILKSQLATQFTVLENTTRL